MGKQEERESRAWGGRRKTRDGPERELNAEEKKTDGQTEEVRLKRRERKRKGWRKRTAQGTKQLWKQKVMKTRKSLGSGREVGGRELRRDDGLQRPAAGLTLGGFAEQTAGRTKEDPWCRGVQAPGRDQKEWGLVEEGYERRSGQASERGELPKGLGKPVELEGNDE